jgi:hypothetical protein
MTEVSVIGTSKYRLERFRSDVNGIIQMISVYMNGSSNCSEISAFFQSKGITDIQDKHGMFQCTIIGTDPGKRDGFQVRPAKEMNDYKLERLCWHLDQHERSLQGDKSLIKGPLLIDEVSKAFLESKGINPSKFFEVAFANPDFLENNKFILDSEEYDLNVSFYYNRAWIYIYNNERNYTWSWGTLIADGIKLPQTIISLQNIKLSNVFDFGFINESQIVIERFEEREDSLRVETDARNENKMVLIG